MAKVRIKLQPGVRTANRASVKSFVENRALWQSYLKGQVVSVEAHEVALIKSAKIIDSVQTSTPPSVTPRAQSKPVAPKPIVSSPVEVQAPAPIKGESSKTEGKPS